ncbi:hypothetical protein DL93DRAFT_2228565 [Clavulina sp. PMI_390]|nr:hypothetical protein DL93DRAFT_2228565 [Clavulina sp. PMI_390]
MSLTLDDTTSQQVFKLVMKKNMELQEENEKLKTEILSLKSSLPVERSVGSESRARRGLQDARGSYTINAAR